MKNLENYINLQDFLQSNKIDLQKKVLPFIEHLFYKIDEHIKKGGRILVLTLTKKSAEEISDFLVSKGYKTYYLHSEIDTIQRWEIIKKLKSGEIDILVGVNLLREGIDLPEVSFIGVIDADVQGFLRSTTSLIQIIGRAARNPNSEVVLYADEFTESILKSLYETYRRRHLQENYNKKHGIIPKKAISQIKGLEVVKDEQELVFKPQIIGKTKNKVLKKLTKKEKEIIKINLKKQLDEAIKKWEFEKATIIRDQLKEIEGNT